MKTEGLRVLTTIPAAPTTLYLAWLSSEQHAAMTSGTARIEPQVGSDFTALGGHVSGKLVVLDLGRRLVMSWRSADFPPEAPDSRVEVHLEAIGGNTRVTVLHTEIPEGLGEKTKVVWNEQYFAPMRAFFSKFLPDPRDPPPPRRPPPPPEDDASEDEEEESAPPAKKKLGKPAAPPPKAKPASREAPAREPEAPPKKKGAAAREPEAPPKKNVDAAKGAPKTAVPSPKSDKAAKAAKKAEPAKPAVAAKAAPAKPAKPEPAKPAKKAVDAKPAKSAKPAKKTVDAKPAKKAAKPAKKKATKK